LAFIHSVSPACPVTLAYSSNTLCMMQSSQSVEQSLPKQGRSTSSTSDAPPGVVAGFVTVQHFSGTYPSSVFNIFIILIASKF
jgi:hypothetical protein